MTATAAPAHCGRVGPVGDNRHLLHCQRYIELSPIRAKIVADPVDYRWSSFRHHGLGVLDPVITPHPVVQGLRRTLHDRQQSYREFVMQAIAPEETDTIRRHLQHPHIYGPDRFRQAIEAQLGRKIGPKKIGRPESRRPKPQTSSNVDSAPRFGTPRFSFFGSDDFVQRYAPVIGGVE